MEEKRVILSFDFVPSFVARTLSFFTPSDPSVQSGTTSNRRRDAKERKQRGEGRQGSQATRIPSATALSGTKMPELPEVENFRRLLLPLVSKGKLSTLTIECPSQTPPRTFLTPEQVKSLNGNCCVKDVLRKGKLICMVMECVKKVQNQDCTCNGERFAKFQYSILVVIWALYLAHSSSCGEQVSISSFTWE
jgi:hypothetical protein